MRAMTYEMEDAVDAAHWVVDRWWPLPSPHKTSEWRDRMDIVAHLVGPLIAGWRRAAPWYRPFRPAGRWPQRRRWMCEEADRVSRGWPTKNAIADAFGLEIAQ